jgi:hypothetical protein
LWVLKIFLLSFSAQDAGHSRENDSNYFFIRKMGRAEEQTLAVSNKQRGKHWKKDKI